MLHLHWIEIYEQVKFWLPLLTVSGLLYRSYTKVKGSVSVWADTLLDNHMTHLQDALERASSAVVQLAGYHREMLDSQKELVNSLTTMQEDIHEHFTEDRQVSSQIVTGVEVIKTKLDNYKTDTTN